MRVQVTLGYMWTCEGTGEGTGGYVMAQVRVQVGM